LPAGKLTQRHIERVAGSRVTHLFRIWR
jgi:hypothetical protein